MYGSRHQAKKISPHDCTISFNYTVDYPKIELHPFDTKQLSILFNDTADGGSTAVFDNFISNLKAMKDGSLFEKKLDIRALSRETRDIISLVIKCFAA